MNEKPQPVDELIQTGRTYAVRFGEPDFAAVAVLLKAIGEDRMTQKPVLDSLSVIPQNTVRKFTGV